MNNNVPTRFGLSVALLSVCVALCTSAHGSSIVEHCAAAECDVLVSADKVAKDTVDDQTFDGDKNTSSSERYVIAKPMMNIHFVKPERYVANLGDTFNVSLTFMVADNVNTVYVDAAAKTGVLLETSRAQTGALAAGEEATVTFALTALSEGRHYVIIVVSAESNSTINRGVYSLPVEVGDINARVPVKSTGNVVVDDQGNTLILMPAVTPVKVDP